MLMINLLWLISDILCAFLLQNTIGRLISISKKPLKRLWMLCCCSGLVGMIIFLGDFYNILPTFFFFLFTIIFTCEGSLCKKISIGLLFSSTVFAFNMLRDNFLLPPHKRLFDYLHSTILFSLSNVLFFLFLFLGTRIFAPEKNYELSDRMWKLLILLTTPPIGIIFSLILLYDTDFWDSWSVLAAGTDYFHRDYLALLILSLFSFIGLLWTISILAKQQKLERQNALAEINSSYYEAMEQHYFEIRRLKHDMANHLQVLSALPTDEQQAYLESLSQNTALTQTIHYCGDATVNAVLAVKENQMNRYGIRLTCSIDIPKELPFDRADLCALFANALDNAIDACRKTEKRESRENDGKPEPGTKKMQKEITLESKAQKGLFCLNVRNPAALTEHELYYDSADGGSLPATSKQDSLTHGFGLKSILEIVRKYQGKMELKTENGMAELFLYMPLYDR